MAAPPPAPLAGSATPPLAGHPASCWAPAPQCSLSCGSSRGSESKCPGPRPAVRVATSFLGRACNWDGSAAAALPPALHGKLAGGRKSSLP